MSIQFNYEDHQVMYTCGHRRIVRFYGDDYDEIDRLIVFHGSMPCPDCPPSEKPFFLYQSSLGVYYLFHDGQMAVLGFTGKPASYVFPHALMVRTRIRRGEHLLSRACWETCRQLHPGSNPLTKL
jgi:hypothetical protein